MSTMSRYADYLLLVGVILTLMVLLLGERVGYFAFTLNVTNTLAAWLALTCLGLAVTILADILNGRHDTIETEDNP